MSSRRLEWRTVAAPVLLFWMALVLGVGAVMAISTAGWMAPGETGLGLDRWIVVGTVVVTCLAAAALAQRHRPELALPVLGATAVAIVLSAAIATGNVRALLPSKVVLLAAWMAGEALLARMPDARLPRPARASVAAALGLGGIGLVLLVLVSLGAYGGTTALATVALTLAAALTARPAKWYGDRAKGVAASLVGQRSWFELLLAAFAVALVTTGILGALVPEIRSDPVRQHLPIARDIWRSGNASDLTWSTARLPIQAHLLYAAGYGFGGASGAKALHDLAGLAALAAVAGLGAMLAGRTGGIVAAATLGAMPVVQYEFSLANVDFFPTWHVVAAAIAVIAWQRTGALAWVAVAGALAGFGIDAKITGAIACAGLGVAILAVGRGPGGWRERFHAAVVYGAMLAAAILPWVARSAKLTGAVPGVDIFLSHLNGSAATSVLPSFGLGRSPADLLAIPWFMTFRGDSFNENGHGMVGFALLMMLPLPILARRSRALGLLATTLVVAYLGWALSAQYIRYLLPQVALLCAVCAAGAVAAMAGGPSRGERLLARYAPLFLVAATALAPLFTIPFTRSWLPVPLLVGRESGEEHVARIVLAYPALAKASEVVGPRDPVIYTGYTEGAQLYSEATLVYMDATDLGSTPEEIAATLREKGTRYVILDRKWIDKRDYDSTFMSLDYLSRHAEPLAAGNNGYLFRIHDDPADRWGLDGPNLLADPDLAVPGPWTLDGSAQPVAEGVRVDIAGSAQQAVPATPGRAYTAILRFDCANLGRGKVSLRWLDEFGREVQMDSDVIEPKAGGDRAFMWRIAPERAASVEVALSASEAAVCTYREAELHERP